jgi:GT2 family glycosyltransferase
MPDPVVSILLVTWKRLDLLAQCLDAIAAAKSETPCEIVIVNNGGARTAERVEAIGKGARIVHSRVNLGLPGGLRLARSAARGKYLALLQDDVLVEAGWLDALVARMDEDPWVGIVGSFVGVPGGQICGLYLLGGLTWLLLPAAAPEPVPVDLCVSASMLIRARAWDDAGGPTAELFPLGYVDFDLCIRVARCGWIIETLGTSRVRHSWHGSTTPALRTYTVERNARPVRKWHADWLATLPREGTLEEMRQRLIERAAAIRAKPPPAGKDPKPFTRGDRARLERIARRGAWRVRYVKLRSLLRPQAAPKA